jgi:hypothetical protein
MAEELKNPEQQVTETVENVQSKSPFSDESWVEAPIQNKIEENKKEEKEEPIEDKNTQDDDTEIVDVDSYFEREFGYKSASEAKTELERLKKLSEEAKTPAEIKFANEESERIFNSLKEGKEEDIYFYLDNKRKIDNAEKADVTKIDQAENIIKLGLKFKYKDLEQSEIEDIFKETYSKPSKPVLTDDETQEEYDYELNDWKEKCESIDKRIVRDAKIAKPELVKFKSEIKLPDIPKVEPVPEQPSQELLDQQQRNRENYLNSLKSGFKNFEGFSTRVKDELVDIPISFKIPEEDRNALVKSSENFDLTAYFESRWLDEKGNWKINQFLSDRYVLDNLEKILQGTANQAASERLKFKTKTDSNIQLNTNGNQKTFVPDGEKSDYNKMAETIWSA